MRYFRSVPLFLFLVAGAKSFKSFYLMWAEVSLFTGHLHFVLLLMAFWCLSHWHKFHVPLFAAILYVSLAAALCLAKMSSYIFF